MEKIVWIRPSLKEHHSGMLWRKTTYFSKRTMPSKLCKIINSNLKYLLRHWSYYYKNLNTFRTVIPRNQFYCSSRIFLENMSMSMEWETSTRVNNLLTTPIRQQQCIVKHDELYTMKEHFLLSRVSCFSLLLGTTYTVRKHE